MEKMDVKLNEERTKADDLTPLDPQVLSLPVPSTHFTSFESDITENEDEDRPLIRGGGSAGIMTASGHPSMEGHPAFTDADTARKLLEYTKHIQGLSADMTSSVESSRDLMSSDNEGTEPEPYRKNIAYMRLAEAEIAEEAETEKPSASSDKKSSDSSSAHTAAGAPSQKITKHTPFNHSKNTEANDSLVDKDIRDTGSLTSKSGSLTSHSGSRSSSSDSPDRTLVEDPANDGDDDESPRGSSNRPNDLTLPKPLQHYERIQRMKYTAEEAEDAVDVLDALAKTPLQSQGTVMKEGELMAFVADDLQEKIKLSSPSSKDGDFGGRERKDSQASSLRTTSSSNYSLSSNSSVTSSSTWSTAATPIHRGRSNADVPPIDPHVLRDLEIQATHISDNLDHMLKKLKSSLGRMSAITVGCVDTYKEAIDNTCDAVDGSIKSMYALMAKCEELSKTVAPIYDIHEQIKEIKRLLDMFEMQIATQDH